MKRRPQWDDSLADRGQYRLTYSEQLQRKAALVSKNKEAGREELQKRQEQLKMGIIPEEIKKTIQNPSKKLQTKSARTLKKSSSAISETLQPTEQNLNQNSNSNPIHFATLKKTKPSMSEHFESLNKLDQAMKDLEAAMLKAASSSPEPKKDINFKDSARDDVISEGSLFGISDDDELGYSKFSEVSKHSGHCGKENFANFIKDPENPFKTNQEFFKPNGKFSYETEDKNIDPYEIEKQKYKAYINPEMHINDYLPASLQSKPKDNKFEIEMENELKNTEKFIGKNLDDDRIPYDNVWDKEEMDDENYENEGGNEDEMFARLIEQTRKDLNTMKINQDPDAEYEDVIERSENVYDSEVVPKKYNLVPLSRPEIPRAGNNSLSIFDHVKNVRIDCRKFII
ncbi:hypothetical protein SteCoe_14127 [Stentor coeruleus]|uniref:Uncharacterized protein n=1 Tax=Stentor coeruleus TaxID=5963 RepID=A0A1R2C731_9CILI|nr:hypothetical protein SteCoe_14127 [Stentor coeruleus]